MYIIVDCPKCRRFWITKLGYKTSRCPRCGYRVTLKPGAFRTFKTLEEARAFLKTIGR